MTNKIDEKIVMSSRLFKKNKDYDIVLSWWNEHNAVPADLDFLSDYGVIVSNGDKDIASLWFYPVVSAKFGIILSPVTNPDTTKEERNEALNLCFNSIHDLAKDLGFTTIMCWSNVPPVENRLNDLGYVPGDKNCTHYWGVL